MQGFDTLAVLLHQHPGFEGLVGFKSLVLGVHEKCDSVPCHIVCEGHKIFSTLAHWGAGWPPHIGVYFITKVLSWRADPDFGDRLLSCAGKYTGIASCFLEAGV